MAQPAGSAHGRELAEGAANLDFIAVNRTGRAIVALSVRPTGEGAAWSEDVLVQDVVPPDERSAVSYTRDLELCRWDIRATFETGQRKEFAGVNLCETIRVVLR